MRCLQLLILFFFSSFLSFARADVEKAVLDNGLTILVQPMPGSGVVSIYAYVKTGSATEAQFMGKGISHFVEHMLFKGTLKRPVGAIAKEVKSLGGSINASTSLDYTIYTLDLPKGTLKQGLDIISDMLMHSAFDPVQVEKEREVIHGEMRLYNDRPDRRLSEDVFYNVYIRHPYRHPTIGYLSLFDSITREELYGYYRSRYIPNNIIVSVAGAVDPDEAMVSIKEAFKDFRPLAYPERNISPEPPQISQRYYEEYYPTPLWRFSFAFQGVALSAPDLYALDVLSMALGQGESSRLYDVVYKKKHLVQQISCSNFTPVDRGVFEIEGVMDKDNVSQVLVAVKDIVEDIQHRGLSSDELTKTRRQVLSQFVFGNQTSSNLAYRAAVDEANSGDPQFSKHYVEAVKHVSNDDIKRVAKSYLIDSALSVTVLKPRDSQKQTQRRDQRRAPTGIQKIILDNGLTVLLKEDHTVPIVTVYAVANAGTRQEDPQLNGISQLFAQMWTKGTRNKTEAQIIKEMEGRGASMGGFAGRNSVGVQAQVLSDDLPLVLDTLADIIAAPLLSDETMNKEKEKMYVSIDERDDDIHEIAMQRLMETLFTQHPYRLDLLGTKASVTKISRSDILAYYNRFVHPNNMVIAVFGDFNNLQVLTQLKHRFAGFKKGTLVLKEFHEPPPEQTRDRYVKVPKAQAMVMFGFQAPVMNGKDRWAMELINTVLGAGLSGRLFVKVRDELGKAYTVGSRYIPGIDAGTIVLFVLTTRDKIDSVKEIVKRELADLRDNPISDDEEIKDAKAHLKGTFKMGLDTSAALASVSVFDELYGLGHDFYQQYDAHVESVTKEDIRRVAGQYLDLNKAAIVTAGAELPQR